MKKKIFIFLGLFSLTLTGCSFSGVWNGFLEFIGIRKKAEPAEDQPSEETPKEPWKLVYSSNASDHWYVDENGVEHKEAHHFKSVSHKDMTCTDPEHEEFKCEECAYTKIVYGGHLKEHVYKSVTTPATCKEEGKTVFTCTECGHVHEVAIPVNAEAHNFVEQGTTDGVTTYKCKACEKTKQIMNYKASAQAEVTKEALQQVDEIQLQNASIAFDDSIFENDLGENVSIAAEAKEPAAVAEELSLSSEEQEKLQGKPIVDFSVTNGESEEKISEFSGTVKVTIPYTLQEGEDPDGIAIWYLSENSNPEAIKATYSDGNVSFETNHFSYYAVVHLTPEESCNKFGHAWCEGSSAESTCMAHGYQDRVCRRCNTLERTALPLAEHKYECTERVDSTTTSEGYLHYVCSTCKDAYDVTIPMKSSTDRGFYTNLLYSTMTPEWNIQMNASLNDVDHSMNMYYGLDNDGVPFEYMKEAEYTDVVYKGISYGDYQVHGTSYGMDTYAQICEYFRDVIDFVPQIYRDKIEELGNFFVAKYYVKSEVKEGYKFTLNFDALQAVYNSFKTNSMAKAIKDAVGEEYFNKVYNFILNSYEKTVGEVYNDLAEKGYNLKELFEAIVKIAKMHNPEMDDSKIPNFDDMLAAYSEMPIIELLEQAISSMGGENKEKDEAHEPTEALKPEAEPVSGEDEMKEEPKRIYRDEPSVSEPQVEESEGEAEGGFLPKTAEELQEIIDGFLSQNLFDFIAGMTKMEKTELVEMVDSYASLITAEHVDMSVIIATDGTFVEARSSIKDFEVDGEKLSATVSMKKDYDKAAVLNSVKAEVDKYNLNKSVFDINANHYDWIIKPYEEYFTEKLGKQCTFKYVSDYAKQEGEESKGSYRDAFISNFEVEAPYSKYNEETGRYESQYGKLVIPVYQEGYRVWHSEDDYTFYPYYGSVIKNPYGLGTALGKNDTGLKYSSNSLRWSSYIAIENEGELIDRYSYSVPGFEFLYNINNGKLSHTKANGSYSYMNASYYKYQLSTWEEYDNYYLSNYGYAPSKHYDDMDDYAILKGVNQFNGEIRFETHWKNNNYWAVHTNYLHKNMNEEALQSCNSFGLRYCYSSVLGDQSLVETVYASNIYNKFDVNPDYWYEYYDKPTTYTDSYSYGNVNITYKAEPASNHSCEVNISYSFAVSGVVTYKSSHKSHVRISSNIERHYLERIDDPNTPCEYKIHYYETCKECGRKIGEGYEWHSDHNYVETTSTLLEPGLTTAGISQTKHECQNCGEFYYSYNLLIPCRHTDHVYDEETHILHCNECGYEVETPVDKVPEFICEKYSEDDSTVTYTINLLSRGRWWFENRDLNAHYMFSLGVGYFDEEGELQVLTNYNDSNLGYSWLEFEGEEEYTWHGYIFAQSLTFNKFQYESLVNEAAVEYPDYELFPVIACAAYDSGTVFYYAIY